MVDRAVARRQGRAGSRRCALARRGPLTWRQRTRRSIFSHQPTGLKCLQTWQAGLGGPHFNPGGNSVSSKGLPRGDRPTNQHPGPTRTQDPRRGPSVVSICVSLGEAPGPHRTDKVAFPP